MRLTYTVVLKAVYFFFIMSKLEFVEGIYPKKERLDLSQIHVTDISFDVDRFKVHTHYVPLKNYLRLAQALDMAELLITELESKNQVESVKN